MRKIYYVLALFLFCSCGSEKTDIQTILMLTAEEMNKMCPMTVDKDTRLDNVVVLSNKTIQYNYTWVNFKLEDLDLSIIESEFFPIILNDVKTNPGLRLFRENKVTVTYYYSDMNGKFVTLFKVTPEKYLY